MQIKQFEDKNLAHYSYAILSDCEQKIILIDPARNPQPYLDFAAENNAEIVGVIETHPHADFVSSHLELHLSSHATVYTSQLVNPLYPFQSFDEGQLIQLGKITLSSLNTPGHSPDSICIVLEHEGKQKAVFTGDTLFIGDCGRPDLRPGNGDPKAAATSLAHQMYHSLRDKLAPLPDATIVYPAHGAGTLCGKALSKANSSTIGDEKETNWSLQKQSEDEFVKEILSDQPFVPAYFAFDVAMNKKGAGGFREGIDLIKIGATITDKDAAAQLDPSYWIVDGRDQEDYKKGHLPHSINLMAGTKFDTWLGSIIAPGEPIYFAGKDRNELQNMIERAAAIGYESQIQEAFIPGYYAIVDDRLDLNTFKANPDRFTIIDVRNTSEVKDNKPFMNSLNIPLAELKASILNIPMNKPIVVHCASGFRSAAGSSLLASLLYNKVTVFDLGNDIKEFL